MNLKELAEKVENVLVEKVRTEWHPKDAAMFEEDMPNCIEEDPEYHLEDLLHMGAQIDVFNGPFDHSFFLFTEYPLDNTIINIIKDEMELNKREV